MAAKGYKRSWKNLLLNKRYQLRFTLFMVALAAVLMSVLGWWVMKEANEATTVAITRVHGEACTKIPTLNDTAAGEEDGAQVPLKLDDEAPASDPGSAAPAADPGSAAAAPTPVPEPAPAPPKQEVVHDPAYLATVVCAGAGLTCSAPEIGKTLVLSGPDCDAVVAGMMQKYAYVEELIVSKVPSVRCEGGKTYPVPKHAPGKPSTLEANKTTTDVVEPEHHVKVQIDESSMTMSLPADFADRVAMHWTCEIRQMGAIASLEAGRMRILWVLIGTGILLVLGLAVYGIKMTHKVAGPLFKVGLYLAKMREGRFDKVYNLRKGDQLVEFYDHFKAAHAGVVQLEKTDIEQIKAVIAAAEAAGAGDHEAVAELRTVLARKEKSIE